MLDWILQIWILIHLSQQTPHQIGHLTQQTCQSSLNKYNSSSRNSKKSTGTNILLIEKLHTAALTTLEQKKTNFENNAKHFFLLFNFNVRRAHEYLCPSLSASLLSKALKPFFPLRLLLLRPARQEDVRVSYCINCRWQNIQEQLYTHGNGKWW